MMDILKFIIILYSILLIPLMLGTLWQKYIVKRHFGIATLVQGWLCMMALFYCEAVPMVLFRRTLSELKNIWVVTMLVITVLFLISFLHTRDQWRNIRDIFCEKWKYAVIPILLILCSIFFLKPEIQDDTLEIVMETVSTNTMYQYQPYTDQAYEELPENKVYAPLEMYDAVLADMVNANPAIVVKIMLPIGFLPIFMLTYVMWAKSLFQKNRKLQRIFLFFTGVMFFLPIISTNMVMFSVWQNCWKGEVLLTTTVLPLVCSNVYNMIVELSQQWNKKKCIEYVLKLLIVSLTAQLTYAKGMLFSCSIILSGILIIVARRCQQKYAANINRN